MKKIYLFLLSHFSYEKNKSINQNEVIITGKWQLAKASENNIKLEVKRL
jgi:hypothetical protein